MGLGVFVETIAGIIQPNFFGQIREILLGDLVGRNTTSGAPEAGKNLGTSLYPWGTLHVGSISLGGSLVDLSDQESAPYKVVSGAKRTGSNQPDFLRANGAAASATLLATTVALELEINGEAVTISADVAMTGLTVAPSTNNTALVNESTAADQAATRLWGENNSRFTDHPTLLIDTAGSEITALVGQYAAFKISNGLQTEYFLAYVQSSTQLSDCRRGYFVDSSGSPVNRIVFSDNDTLTLMKLAWVFAKSDGTVDVSYKNPSISAAAPSSPATNDYWFDLASRLWKQYDGAVWNEVERNLVGLLVIDSTNCVASRSFDFFCSHRGENSLELEYVSASTARAKTGSSVVGVMGTRHRYVFSRPTWDMASHLATSADMYDATEQASRTYHLYLTDEGAPKISDIQPYWRPEYEAWYHPHLPWRYLGDVGNDSGSNIHSTSVFSEKDYNHEAKNRATSGSSSSFSTTAVYTSPAIVTNLNSAITVRPGRRVLASLAPAVGQVGLSAPQINTSRGTSSPAESESIFTLYRASLSDFSDETAVLSYALGTHVHNTGGVSTIRNIGAPPSFGKDNPGAGTWYYRVKCGHLSSTNSPVTIVKNCVLELEEVS